MTPAFNNVYGHVLAPKGLEPVLAAVERLACWDRAGIKRSGFSGQQTLHLRGENAELETTPVDMPRHLFNGAVGGSTEEVIAFVQRLSEVLHQHRVEHGFEIYDSNDVLAKEIGSPDAG